MKNAMKALIKISCSGQDYNLRDSCVVFPVYEATCYEILTLDSTKSKQMKR
jgi:hypothetical protein